MSGLVLKDFLFMKKQVRYYLAIIVVYCVLCFFWDQPGILLTLGCVVSMIYPIQAFAGDEGCHWQMMERILPVSLGRVVLARYLSTLLVSLAAVGGGALVMWIYYAVRGEALPNEMLFLALCIAGVVFLIEALVIPVLYRYGSSSGRLVMIVILVLVFGAVYLCSHVIGLSPDDPELNRMLMRYIYFFPAVGFVCLIPSCLISLALYRKKEY